MTFRKQIDTISCRQTSIDNKGYLSSQLGVFAQEVGAGGVRRSFVSTYAGAAYDHAPMELGGENEDESFVGMPANMQHMYDVILEYGPCWLYFDLEYGENNHAHMEDNLVMAIFLLSSTIFAQAYGVGYRHALHCFARFINR